MNFNPKNISDNLTNYINKVEKSTKHQLKIMIDQKLGALSAVFKPDPFFLKIVINPRLINDKDMLEQSIAHELAHAHLIYSIGFHNPKSLRKLTREEQGSGNIALVAADDIPANILIAKEGFSPFAPNYLDETKKETKKIKKGKIRFEQFKYSQLVYHRWAVLRYILAYSFIHFINIAKYHEKIIRKYLNVVKKYTPDVFNDGEKIIKIFKRKNMLDPNDNKIIKKEIFKLWELDDAVD